VIDLDSAQLLRERLSADESSDCEPITSMAKYDPVEVCQRCACSSTKERYIKAFDPAVLDAMQRLQATVDVLEKSPAIVQQMN
jgi:hypothetical protein